MTMDDSIKTDSWIQPYCKDEKMGIDISEFTINFSALAVKQ